jgi:glucose 1-dehydrogenase
LPFARHATQTAWFEVTFRAALRSSLNFELYATEKINMSAMLDQANRTPSMNRLSNKRILVTGATQGIGRAATERFLEEGAIVVLTDAVPDSVLVETVAGLEPRYGGRIFSHHLDVTDEASVLATFAAVRRKCGGLDVLVNNAGINRQNPTHAFTTEDFDRVMAVNLRGPFLCSREALKLFLEQGAGLILNTSSTHELVPKPEFIAYSVSKGGLGNLTRTIALEYADRNIRANSVAPGATITPMNASWKDDPHKRSQVEGHIPLGRSASPAEIASVLAYLASDEAAYITGQTIYIDGGVSLHTDFRTNWSS